MNVVVNISVNLHSGIFFHKIVHDIQCTSPVTYNVSHRIFSNFFFSKSPPQLQLIVYPRSKTETEKISC